jgi:hypothetical protein
MRAKNKSTRRICIGDSELEEVQHFKYLGSYILADSNIEKEISTRIVLAAQAFNGFRNIWNFTCLQTKAKTTNLQIQCPLSPLRVRDLENKQED